MATDDLGRQPRHLSGVRFPDFGDLHASARASAATEAFKTNWIDHAPQAAIIARVLQLHRDSLAIRPQPLGGRLQYQDSNAGKLAPLDRLKQLSRAQKPHQ